jgi:hypothetical protein
MERDKFLTEAMGINGGWYNHEYVQKWGIIDFQKWAAFGMLWEWAQKQEWWNDFFQSSCYEANDWFQLLINPDRFANAVYEFLKENS